DLEPTDARRVFPCFDEPGFKVPWTLTLRVPPQHVALGNAPEASSRIEGDWKVVELEPTAPLPSYLVAFAVRPFEVIDAAPAKSGAPQRIFVPRGRSDAAGVATRIAGEALRFFEDYTGVPYPYAKLDHVAVPGTGNAMENAGLIRYDEQRLLMSDE